MKNRPTIYEYCRICPVYDKYPDLCYGLMDKETRETALGNECPIQLENERVPDDNLICPTGLVRRLVNGRVRGERL